MAPHADAIEREMAAIADFCRESSYPSRMLIEEHCLKRILAKTPNPVYLKDDRFSGHRLIEHIQFQFSACKRKKISI